MSQQVCTREPDVFAAGDTLAWTRTLSRYSAADGWGLTYELRGGGGGGVQAIAFSSTAGADGVSHVILVAAAVTALWLPANYVMTGFAVNAGTGERHQFFLGDLPVLANAMALPGDVDNRTFAQKGLALVEARLLELWQHVIADSKNGETEFYRETRKNYMEQRAELLIEVRNETDQLRARNGQPNRNKIRARFFITTPGYFVGPQSGVYPFGFGGDGR